MSDHTILIIQVVKIFFVQFFCGFLPPLLNIFCFCRSIPFLSFIKPMFAWNVPLISLFFLKRTLVFPILLFSSISLHWTLRKAFLSLLVILWDSALKWVYLSFSLLPFVYLLCSAICKASSDNHFPFLHLFFLWMVLMVLCNVTNRHPQFFRHSIRSKPLNLFVTSTG